MNDQTRQDSAWVCIETPLPPNKLELFIDDLERLFRINSLLEIERWEAMGEGNVSFVALNLSNGMPLQSELRVERCHRGMRVHYDNLLKSFTSFQVAPSAKGGSTLTVTDDYSGTGESERRRRLAEVDLSLTQWGRDLHRYLQAWNHWSWLPPWRWYMRRVWQPMKPAARRITRLLIWVSLGEMALVLLLIAILAIEQ